MSTVIDSFVVELGLDPSKFNKGQTEAFQAMKNFRESAVGGAKDIEEQSKKSGEALGGIKTQFLEIFAVIAGGKSVIGFAKEVTTANAQLGRLERNIGVSSKTISEWQGAAAIFGGSAQGMAQSFTAISDAFAGWKIGVISPLIADFRAISTAGGTIIDVNKGVEQSFRDLSTNLKAIHDRDPATAGLLGRRAGIDPGLFDLLIQGPEKLQQVLNYVNKIGTSGKDATDTFGELEKRFAGMGLKAESLARKLLTGDGGKGGIAAAIMEWADVLNMKPAEAWAYLNRKDRETKPGDPGQPIFGTPAGAGAFSSQVDKEAFIREQAKARGMDPDVAMKVARSEGFNNFKSSIPGETSYSAFQLHVTPGGRGGHLGDQFRKDTGLDPSDPANERRAIQYALDDAKRNGWKAFHGAANTGIGNWSGINPGRGGSTTTTTVEINGPITVTPPAGSDATTFAQRFAGAVKQQSFAAQANGGQD